MVQGDDFLYFLRSNDLYYYVDDSGNVLTTTDTRSLNFTPEGWNEIALWTERNKKYFGLDRSFTIPLHFVEDGARILKYLLYLRGLEVPVTLLIREQKLETDVGTYEFIYEDLYEGEIDFSTINDQGFKVGVNILEGGLPKLLKANENTLYEFPVDELKVKMDGLVLKASSNYLVPSDVVGDYSILQGSFRPSFAYSLLWLQLQFVSNDGSIFDTEQNSVAPLTTWSSNSPFDDNHNTDQWFFKADAAINVTLKGNFSVTLRSGAYVRLYVKNSNGTRTVLFTLNGTDTPGEILTQTYNISQVFNLAAGEQLYLISELLDISSPNGSAEYTITPPFQDINFQVVYNSRYQTTYINALTAHTLFRRIVEKITDGKFEGYSELLHSRPDLVITSGDGLRGIDGAKIKTSLAQFFDAINAVLNVGMGIAFNRLQLEKKEFWFDASSVIDLEPALNLQVTSANDFIFNTIKVGYPNQDYDNVNGKDEPNTTHTYTTPITKVVKEYNIVSPYRADMYGIEFTRIQGKTTTDTSDDNDTFFLQVNIVPQNDTGFLYYTLDRSLNGTATGLIDPPSAFNLGLSPKHMLLAHGWFIRSFMYGLDNQLIKFQTTDKNPDLVTDVVEKADVLISDLPAPKFYPFIFEVDTRVPEDYQQLINSNPVRAFTFTYQDIQMKGISMKSGIEPSTNKAQTYTLLATADNDMIQLINFNQ